MTRVRRLVAPWCAALVAACTQVSKLDQFEFVDPGCASDPVAVTCKGIACGPTKDNCGRTVLCPSSCVAPQICGGGDAGPNGCGCTAEPLSKTCQGFACGKASDNCGKSVACPDTCVAPQTCGGGNAGPNGCGCAPEDPSATCMGKACGKAMNNCAQAVDCANTCAAPKICGGCGAGPNDCGCECASAADCKAQQSCVAMVCVPGRTVFFSSSAVLASMGGVAGGDVTCATAAKQAGLKGSFKAWLSGSATSAAARLEHANVPYRLVDGTEVAASWAGLTAGALEHAIDRDENGALAKNPWEVWTGTAPDGSSSGVGCDDWTNGAANAPITTVGIAGHADASWTNAYAQFCNRNDVHLYCIEQAP